MTLFSSPFLSVYTRNGTFSKGCDFKTLHLIPFSKAYFVFSVFDSFGEGGNASESMHFHSKTYLCACVLQLNKTRLSTYEFRRSLVFGFYSIFFYRMSMKVFTAIRLDRVPLKSTNGYLVAILGGILELSNISLL